MEFFSRKQTAKMLGVSLSTLDNLRQERKIGYYQKYPGCKVQFTQAHIDKYLKRVARIENPRSEESRRVKSDENRDDIRD